MIRLLQLVSQHGRIGIGSGFMGQLEPFKRCSLYTRFSAHICCQATTLAGFPQLLKPPLARSCSAVKALMHLV